MFFFEDRDSTIDFATHQLNFSVQDDQLIASILLNRQEAPERHLVLVTSDLGLALVAKAGRQGVSTQKMPDNFRIADEPDPNENKVKQLEKQIQDLSSRTPKLSLIYVDGKQHTAIILPNPASLEKSEIEAKIAEIKNKYPQRKQGGPNKETEIFQSAIEQASMISSISMINAIPQEEIERYNKELENYIPSYINFLSRKNDYENLKRRTVRLDIDLANDGTTPAEDIDIYMYFPDGFRLVEEADLPISPEPPKSPTEPMTEMERLANSLRYGSFLTESVLYNPPIPSPELSQNVSRPNIKQVNSYEVHVHVQKIKHNLQVSLDPLFIIFTGFENAKSFTINYKILAANIPHEVTGSLHIAIERE